MTYPGTITLTRGAHETRAAGVCLLEAAAWFAGKSHTDQPACVSPVLAAYGRSLNDALPDDSRQLLVPFVPLMPGTAGDGLDEARGYLALDWLIRVHTPAWLDLAGLADEARALRDLSRITDLAAAQAARPVVLTARNKATAARDATKDAARAAAWDAAWAAAGDAAWNAAWAAAGAAAGDAAWDAAGDAAWAAARDAARDAAWAAARDTARDAAGNAAWDDAAWDAAWDAARDVLAPTVTQLQESAIVLFSAMIHPETTP